MQPQTENLRLTLILLMIIFGRNILLRNNTLGLDWEFGQKKNNVDKFYNPDCIMILIYKKYRLHPHSLVEKDCQDLQCLAS